MKQFIDSIQNYRPTMPDAILKVLSVSKKFEKATSRKINGEVGWNSLVKQLIKRKEEFKETKSFYALNDINLCINRGESLGIIGLNGSGKSTLLQIIAGTMKPTAGHIEKKGRVAALLELGSGFNPQFTGRENVYLNAALLGLSTEECTKSFSKIEEFAEIGDFIDQPVSTYSSGMCLRLAFAVIANISTEILIVDEALAVGDATFQLKCYSFLEHFKRKGGSLILVSHDLNSIARLCSISILLHKGLLLMNGETRNVINEYSKILTPENEKKLNCITAKIKSNNQILKFEDSQMKEFAYGGKTGLIKKPKLFNFRKEQTKILNSGEKFYISFEVEALETVVKPIYAIVIRDNKGQQIYGQNTYFSKTATKDLLKGTKKKVEFQLSLNLGAGDYLISLGLTRLQKNKIKVIHRRYDALEMKVLNDDGSIGMANCFCKIIVNNESK